MRAHRGVSRRIGGHRRTPTDCICESCLIVGFSQEARFTLTYQQIACLVMQDTFTCFLRLISSNRYF